MTTLTPTDPTARARLAAASLTLALTGVPIRKDAVPPRPLYVSRSLLSGASLLRWAHENGIPDLMPAWDLHVTIAYSRAPVDWLAMGRDWGATLEIPEGGPRVLVRLGPEQECVALAFGSDSLRARHMEMRERGASWDWPQYIPHITLSSSCPPEIDIDAIAPFQGRLVFGPEVFAALETDRLAKAKGWSTQPRVSSGPKGGQWTSGSGGTAGGLIAPHLGIGNPVAEHRYKQNAQQAAFMKPLTQAEIAGVEPYLGNPLGLINQDPRTPSNPKFNHNPLDTATFVAGADPGEGLNGVPFKPWDGPEGGDWSRVDGTGSFDEPPVPNAGKKGLGAGVVIEESDGRVWTINPLNRFGGYDETLPKGGIEPGLNLRQTAIKEAFEESGLKVELTGYIGDFERTTSVARYYRARRVGGSPTDFHWETAATNLVPKDDLPSVLTHASDKPLVAALLGAAAPVVKALLAMADAPACVVDEWERMTKAKGKGGKKPWSSQPRVPAGLPKGGQWTKGGYGSGGYGAAFAAGGMPLTLQKYDAEGPQQDALNAKIAKMEAEANAGVLSKETLALTSKAKPQQTYSSKAWESAQEAKAYVEAVKSGAAAKTAVAAGKTPVPDGSQKQPMMLASMTKVGAKPGGTAQGAVYEDTDGVRWLVKSYPQSNQAYNEVTAARLYALAGTPTPEIRLVQLGGAYHGGMGVASRMLDDIQPFDKTNAGQIKAAQADFGAHAFLANWDAVGADYDNLALSGGKVVQVDPGGALLYRAMGKTKGDGFVGDGVPELHTMRDSSVNAQAAKVFGSMTQTDIIASVKPVLEGLSDGKGKLNQAARDAILQTMPANIAKPLIDKLDGRMKALDAYHSTEVAKLASTTKVTEAETGTTTAAPTGKPNVFDNYTAEHLTSVIENIDVHLAQAKSKIDQTSPDAKFYNDIISFSEHFANSGNMLSMETDFYDPPSAAAKASAQYKAYKDVFAVLQTKAMAVATKNMKTSGADAGQGSILSGTDKISTETIKTMTTLAGDKIPTPDVVDEAPPAVKHLGPASDPAPAPTPLPALPPLQTFGSATNKKTALNAKAQEVYKLAQSDDPDKAAKIKSIADSVPNSQSYDKAGKKWMHDVLAALGGAPDMTNATPAQKEQVAKVTLDAKAIDGLKDVPPPGAKQTAPNVWQWDVETDIPGTSAKQITTYELKGFDPADVPKFEKDFNDWKGPGQGLSQHKAFNDDNNTKVAAIYELGIQNNEPELKVFDPGPSQYVKGYKENTLAVLSKAGRKKIVATKWAGDVTPETVFDSIAKDAKAAPVSAHGLQQIGGWTIVGKADTALASAGFSNALPQTNIHHTQALFDMQAASFTAAKAKGGKFTPEQKIAAIEKWTSDNYALSNDLRSASTSSTTYQKAFQLAAAANEASVPVPDGTILIRTLRRHETKFPKAEFDKLIKTGQGKVLQDVAPASWRYDPTDPWVSGSDTVTFVGVTRPGARGVMVSATEKNSNYLGSYSHEREILLAPSNRVLVERVWTAQEWQAAGRGTKADIKTGYVVEGVILPQHEGDFFSHG